MIFSNASNVQLAMISKSLMSQVNKFRLVLKFVAMVLNIKLNAMIKILLMEMDAAINVLLNLDGHAVEDLQPKSQFVINLFQIKQFLPLKELLILETELFKVLELHIYQNV